jgi:fructose PTS system EIIA component
MLDSMPQSVANSSLTSYTRASLIVPHLKHRDTAGIIGELAVVLQTQGCLPDMLPFYHAALNQELLTNSAQDCGIALPHARLSGVKELQFAFGRAPTPVNWGAKGAWPVQLVFLLAVPATDAARYLNLLASIARLGQQPDCLEALRKAQTAEEILNALQKVRTRQG